MRVTLKFSLIVILLAAAAAGFVGCKSSGSQAAGLGTEKPLPNEPEVTFKDLQGKDVSLASLKGKVVLVNFWATWCEPCQVEIPWMINFQKKYADKGFTLLGVAMDEVAVQPDRRALPLGSREGVLPHDVVCPNLCQVLPCGDFLGAADQSR